MELTIEKANEIMERNNGNLYLRGTQITSLPENLTVGGWLDLRGTQITSLPENLTVGGSLDLRGTQITSLPESLRIGREIYSDFPVFNSSVYSLSQGEYVPGKYLFADGILTLVKSTKKIGDYTFYIGKIKGRNVISDGEYYAHCNSPRDGIQDLIFKRAKERGTSQFKNLTLDSELSAGEMIQMYRIITGACRQGTERFVSSLGKLKDKYTVREAIELTRGQYGAEVFEGFFK